MSGPSPDKKCVFPFVFKGQTYEECTTAENNGVHWCSTEVDSQGIHFDDTKWGHCGETCVGNVGTY